MCGSGRPWNSFVLICIEFCCVDLTGRIMRLKFVFKISAIEIVLKYPLLSYRVGGRDLISMSMRRRRLMISDKFGVRLREELRGI